MPQSARQGDTISHGGFIISGSENVFVDFRQKARRGDPVLCYYHGMQSIAGGSEDVITNFKGAARVGDAITCGASIVSGSEDVIIDGA